MLENIEVGAMGWQCGEAFYPPDLPEDWQVDYYANYFSALLTPQRVWTQWDEAQAQAFVESADGLRWCGLGVKQPLTPSQVRLAHSILEGLEAEDVHTGMISHVDVPASLQRRAAIAWLGRPDAKATWRWRALSGAPVGWVETLPEDVMAQRLLLEEFVRHLPAGCRGCPFIVRDGCANMAALSSFKQLVELMGL